jgi:hypothetical protein
MLEPTITQNTSLYFAQHRPAKRRFAFLSRLNAAARKDRIVVKQQQAFENLLLWRLLHRADKR